MSNGFPVAIELVLAGLQVAAYELFLFSAFWFVIGAADEVAVDLVWAVLRLTGRAREPRAPQEAETRALSAPAAVLVPAWHEAAVIADMVRHTLAAWPQREMTLFVGCYRNDPATAAAAWRGGTDDARLRVVVHDRVGPTTKADCLNLLYQALLTEEERTGTAFGGVVLHDAEDMVHPAALAVIDEALQRADFVQLPVRPEPQPHSPWVAGHYCDEFTEAHAKALVVRDALGAGIPAAGVGCGFSRAMLERLARRRAGADGASGGPFAEESLTEDYELGLLVGREGARSRFIRVRDRFGSLVATRAYFPDRLDDAVRQKARWIHGIAFQGWDRLGWTRRPVDVWMALRDRRGPLTAIVLASAYLMLMIEAILLLATLLGWERPAGTDPMLRTLVAISFASLAWRAMFRFWFTAREYGLTEGMRAVLRIPVANVVSILAGRRAIFAYVHTLRGAPAVWDKTVHSDHPAAMR